MIRRHNNRIERQCRALPWLRPLCGLLVLWLSTATAAAAPPSRPNFSLHYTVAVSTDPRKPAAVTTAVAGANELLRIVWRTVDPQWFHGLEATGMLTPAGDDTRRTSGHHEWIWKLEGIEGEARYRVMLNRSRTVKGFDSYHGGTWILTRTSDLFPRKRYTSRVPIRGLTRVAFHLPTDWQVVSAMRRLDAVSFEARDRGAAVTAPYGWLMMGDLQVLEMTVDGLPLTIASPRVMQYDATALTRFLQTIIPRLGETVAALPPQLLIVVGPDPLWRGGLSGEDSLYMNQNIPLISPDYTSTIVHELFHTAQGFRKGSTDADWIVEGLAEYYSLKILRDTKLLTRRHFVKGIRKFDRQGLWHVNFRTTHAQKALYNSAPLLFFTLDEEIRALTNEERTLHDIVKSLARYETISTARFQKALETMLPSVDWGGWFRHYVTQGKRPAYERYLKQYTGPSSS